jgi:hypothetical protein
VWPENWAAVRVLLRMGRRWVVGMGGPVCLENSFAFWLEMENVPREQWSQVTWDVQIMEAEMLRVMRERE